MHRLILRSTVLVLLTINGFALAVRAQNSHGSMIAVRIDPETHLDPSTVPLSFLVTNPGETLASAPITVSAWVRSLPSQQIQLSAQPVALNGPDGAMPLTAIGWTGVMNSATGGGTAATCTSGNFASAGMQQLIAGWNQSGIAKCKITFTLTTDPGWPQGLYSGEIVLRLLAQ